MKHSIRQRVLDPVTGLKVTKIQSVNGELGSRLYDKNGHEFFEGDIVKEIVPPGYVDWREPQIVIFRRGEFILINKSNWPYRKNCGATPLGWFSQASLEIVEHFTEEQS